MTISVISWGDGVDRAGSGFETNVATASATAGDTIVAYMRWSDTGSSPNNITGLTITCDGESNLTLINDSTGANSFNPLIVSTNNFAGHWAILPSLSSGGVKTVRCTPGGGCDRGYCISVWLLRGCNGKDGNPFNSTGSGTTASTSGTSTQTKDCVLAVCRNDGGNASGVGGSFTQRAFAVNIWGYNDASDWADSGAVGSKTASFTIGSAAWMVHGLLIKSADGVAGGTAALSGSAVTGGIGTIPPGTSIGL